MVMNGDATTGVLPGVSMTVVTKKTGWPLNRSKYSGTFKILVSIIDKYVTRYIRI